MKRRDFVRSAAAVGALAGSGLAGANRLLAGTPLASAGYDLVALKGADPVTMFNRGMEALGGMASFVKKGQSVVVKPNIGWDAVPEKAANVNPQLVGRVVASCFEAGASKVYVFDHTCDTWTKCYKNSGIEKEAKSAGAVIVPAHTEGYYQEVTVGGAKSLKTTKVHELVLESDVFINIPVLKDHSSTKISCATKNLMGVVWDRGWWHKNDLHQCIADYAGYSRKPDLNIVDAYNVMMKNGPRGVSVADVNNMKAQLISTDMVAVDAAATKLFGLDPGEVDYIKKADKMGYGTMDLSTLNIGRIKI